MKKIISLLLTLLPVLAHAQQNSVPSGVYKWSIPLSKMDKISSAILLKGKIYDFEKKNNLNPRFILSCYLHTEV